MTSSAPLVSVIIPSRDRPDRVIGAIESVLAQSYPNLQIVVVDDGSARPIADIWGSRDTSVHRVARPTEAAGADAQSGADAQRDLELIRLPVPVGAAAARNVGLAHARGDFVAFLDDDDRFERDKVAAQVAFFMCHAEHGLVTCQYFAVTETSRRAPTIVRPPLAFTAEQLLWANLAGSFSQVMLRRSRLGDAVSIDEGYYSVEDWDLWLRCVQRAPAGTVPRPLVRYVSHLGPRLSDPTLKRVGLERFYERYAPAMSPACRSFHQAHRTMEVHGSLRRRVAVARALIGASPGAWPALFGEQLARQLGRIVGDPGLALRLIATIGATHRAPRCTTDRSCRRPGTVVGGVRLDALDAQAAVRHIVESWAAGFGGIVVTPNVDIVRLAARHQILAQVLASADLALADGMPLVWASRIAGDPLPERVAMSELITPLARAAGEVGAPLFLLGDSPSVGEEAAEVLRKLAPGLVVAGTWSPEIALPLEPAVVDAVAEQLAAVGPAIVVCAFGCPKQELLMAALAPRLPGTWLLAAGATLRMLAGAVTPAPPWMRQRGLEWLHRLRLEPRRLASRYLLHDTPMALRLLLHAALHRRTTRSHGLEATSVAEHGGSAAQRALCVSVDAPVPAHARASQGDGHLPAPARAKRTRVTGP